MNFNLDFSKAQTISAGQTIQFAKDNPGLTKVRAELYWQSEHDADVSVLVLENGKILPGLMNSDSNSTKGMLWYFNPVLPGLKHSGDVLESTGTGPEETIYIDLSKTEGDELLIVASTDCGGVAGQSLPGVPFGKVRNCKILIINDLTNEVLYSYELDEDFSTYTSVEMASFYVRNNEWRFKSRGVGVANTPHGLEGIYLKYKG
jgi:tellurium resistance protein TerD